MSTANLKKPAATFNQLEQLRRITTVVADTGDFATLKEYTPRDATTNPSLILKAALMPEYQHLVAKAIADNRSAALSGPALVAQVVDYLLVLFGQEILQIVPGRVSTETDANLSFDTAALVAKGRKFIALYEKPVSAASASSLKSPPPGKASRPPSSCSRRASTATSRSSSPLPKPSPAPTQR